MSSNQRLFVKPFLSGELLVTRAGGKLRMNVFEELLNQGATNIIATTRNPSKLTDLVTRGIEVREADFDKFETLGPVFKGANRLLLISTDALNNPRQRLRQHRVAIKTAIDSRLGCIIYTSIPNPHPASEPSVLNDHFWTEVALFESLLNWTILRNNLYSEMIAPELRWSLSLCTGKYIFDVTGPAVISHNTLARSISDITELNLSRNLNSNHFDKDAAQGCHATVSSTVEGLSGYKPVSSFDYLQDHTATWQNPCSRQMLDSWKEALWVKLDFVD
ncbi:putative nucleoside-diphosphate sugar epimerase [Trichoderma sp. SZMC 28012]